LGERRQGERGKIKGRGAREEEVRARDGIEIIKSPTYIIMASQLREKRE
jgi:hypothetical protein